LVKIPSTSLKHTAQTKSTSVTLQVHATEAKRQQQQQQPRQILKTAENRIQTTHVNHHPAIPRPTHALQNAVW
jgi:hypothetical protein